MKQQAVVTDTPKSVPAALVPFLRRPHLVCVGRAIFTIPPTPSPSRPCPPSSMAEQGPKSRVPTRIFHPDERSESILVDPILPCLPSSMVEGQTWRGGLCPTSRLRIPPNPPPQYTALQPPGRCRSCGNQLTRARARGGRPRLLHPAKLPRPCQTPWRPHGAADAAIGATALWRAAGAGRRMRACA